MVTVNIVTSGVQTVATRPFHTEVRVAEIPAQVVCTPVSSAAFACGTTTVNSATSGAMTVSRIQANAVPIAPVIAAQAACTPASSAAFACGTTTVNSSTSGATTLSRIHANAVPIAAVIPAQAGTITFCQSAVIGPPSRFHMMIHGVTRIVQMIAIRYLTAS